MLQEANHSANQEPGSGGNQGNVRIGDNGELEPLQSHSQPQTDSHQQEPRSPQQQQQQQQQQLEQQQTKQQQQQQQQQTEQQQKARLADSTVLEWCSKAEELMQQASMGKQRLAREEAVPVQSPFGPLHRGLTALPAYSGTATAYCLKLVERKEKEKKNYAVRRHDGSL